MAEALNSRRERVMTNALNVLMTDLIEYGGLFPSAGQAMPEAIRHYAEYLGDEEGNWLGRFLVPVGRLKEFQEEHARAFPEGGAQPWRLAVQAGLDLRADLASIAAFDPHGAVIDSIDIRVTGREEIVPALEQVPGSLMAYFEIGIRSDLEPMLARLGYFGGRAKVCIGGVDGEVPASASELARFLTACARHRIGFKVAAGYHQPFSAVPAGEGAGGKHSHGFLNLLLAAACARDGADREEIEVLLREGPQGFDFSYDAVKWRERRLNCVQLQQARTRFAISYACSSLRKPIRVLQGMGLLD